MAATNQGDHHPIELPTLEWVDLQADLLDSILDLVARDLPGLWPGLDDPMHLVAQ